MKTIKFNYTLLEHFDFTNLFHIKITITQRN